MMDNTPIAIIQSQVRARLLAEVISHVDAYTRTVKGKEVNVRAHVRDYDAVDERGNSIEVDEDGVAVIDEHLKDIALQDIIDGFKTGREDFKVGNILVTGYPDHEGVLFITGLILDEKGKSVGDFDRSLNFNNFIVSHDQITITPKERAKGIVTDFNSNLFEMYRGLGFKAVTTYADGGRGVDGVGRYAWAMQGFDFSSKSQRDVMRLGFSAYLKEKGFNDTAEAVMKMNHSWEIASTIVNGHKIGKEFMIMTGPNWRGVMKLDNTAPSSKVFETYAKNSKGKGTK